MARQYPAIPDHLKRFIEAQPLFFVATALADGRINLSPKGLDGLRVVGPNRVLWLNLTGSGNETAAHVQRDPRMTLMFCAFEGDPLILRLYGKAQLIAPHDPRWPDLYGWFEPTPGARQIFDFEVELVQTSCGMGVPLMCYEGQRSELLQWAERKGEAGIRAYWLEKNRTSLDGLPTGIERDAE